MVRRRESWRLSVILTMFAFSNVTSAQNYAREVIARIEFGNKDCQVGASWRHGESTRNEGVRSLAVDRSGNLYLGDYVNGKIKKFTHKGELLALTEGTVANFQAFVVDGSGNIIVHNEAVDSRLTKFDKEGKLIWSRSFRETVSRSDLEKAERDFSIQIEDGFYCGMSVGPRDELVIRLNGWERKSKNSEKARHRAAAAVLDGDGKLIRFLPRFATLFGGLWWAYEASVADNKPPPSVVVNGYTATGKLVKSVPLDTGADKGIHYAGLGKAGVPMVAPDRQRGFCVVTYLPRLHPIEIAPTASVRSDIVLNRYDANGKFLEQLRMPASPFGGIASNIAIAPDGSIYHLRFDRDGMDVVKYTTTTK